jgi:hypothetical protein
MTAVPHLLLTPETGRAGSAGARRVDHRFVTGLVGILAVLFVSACGGAGSEFVGTWMDSNGTTLEITDQGGGQFKIDVTTPARITPAKAIPDTPAKQQTLIGTYENGMLFVPGFLGQTLPIAYDKSDQSLNVAGQRFVKS